MPNLHLENTLWNARLAKRNTMPKHRNILIIGREIGALTPDEVLRQLKKMGITRSKSTLKNYYQNGLIPRPDTKSAGRGKGKIADYPDETPSEFFASYTLRHGDYKLNGELLKDTRNLALKVEEQKITGQPDYPKKVKGKPWTWNDFAAGKHEPQIPDFVAELTELDEPGGEIKLNFAFDWIRLKHSKLIPGCECNICTNGNIRLLLKLYKMADVSVIVTSEDIEKMQKEEEEL